MVGKEVLYMGEMATVTAIIDPRISSVSKVYWQKKGSYGDFQPISINDGKYVGSKTEFPSPILVVNFFCQKDEGEYRIVIDSYNKVSYRCIKLTVIQGGM